VLPVGPLMIEHRLIERMIARMKKEMERIDAGGDVDPQFIDVGVDFIRNYADHCHHGKEEKILFRDLEKRSLTKEHREKMDELIQDHIWARQTTGKLFNAKEAYLRGEEGAVDIIINCMKDLTDFYPKHIIKEDKHFFRPVMDYFTKDELDAMLEEEYKFDRNFVHHLYTEIVEKWEKKTK
jgi:hemerythrin-like domain-containing protein